MALNSNGIRVSLHTSEPHTIHAQRDLQRSLQYYDVLGDPRRSLEILRDPWMSSEFFGDPWRDHDRSYERSIEIIRDPWIGIKLELGLLL